MRNVIMVSLIIVNVVLAGILVFRILDIPQAKAQPIGMSGNYLMVSGAILGRNADAVYIVDLDKRKLHALFYDRARRTISHQGTKDLVKDLSGEGVTVKTKRRTRKPRRH